MHSKYVYQKSMGEDNSAFFYAKLRESEQQQTLPEHPVKHFSSSKYCLSSKV